MPSYCTKLFVKKRCFYIERFTGTAVFSYEMSIHVLHYLEIECDPPHLVSGSRNQKLYQVCWFSVLSESVKLLLRRIQLRKRAILFSAGGRIPAYKILPPLGKIVAETRALKLRSGRS